MKRAQIQLDDRTYAVLRRRAYEQGCSISALAREILARSLKTTRPRQRLTINHFSFVGAGSTRQRKLAPVSERHDEALADALANTKRP